MSELDIQKLFDFSGKTVLVTGASSGIGKGLALRFAEAGANVAIHYRSGASEAADLVQQLKEQGSNAHAFRAELTQESDVVSLFSQILETFGGLDVLINNAGIFPNCRIEDMSLENWQTMMDANTASVFLCTREAAQKMENGGAIVNISSISGLNAGPAHAHYNSSKAAVLMFTQSAAQEFGPQNIRVNAVSPGLINREGIRTAWPDGVKRWEAKAPLARMGEPSDIADACLFLASPGARFITGINLPVDGGVMASSIY